MRAGNYVLAAFATAMLAAQNPPLITRVDLGGVRLTNIVITDAQTSYDVVNNNPQKLEWMMLQYNDVGSDTHRRISHPLQIAPGATAHQIELAGNAASVGIVAVKFSDWTAWGETEALNEYDYMQLQRHNLFLFELQQLQKLQAGTPLQRINAEAAVPVDAGVQSAAKNAFLREQLPRFSQMKQALPMVISALQQEDATAMAHLKLRRMGP